MRKLATFIVRYDDYRSGHPDEKTGRLASIIRAYRDTYAKDRP